MTLGFFYVEVPSERLFCPSCGSTFTRRPSGILERSSVTEAFRHFAICCQGRSIQSVSRQLSIAYTMLERWFYDDAASIESPSARRVGMDDFALRKGHSYGVCTLDLGCAKDAKKRIFAGFCSVQHSRLRSWQCLR